MSLFYDPKDTADQRRIESILNKNDIVYSLHPEPVTGKGPLQIYVSEKDQPHAEELIMHRDNNCSAFKIEQGLR